jgi:vacuolar protein sorting-associated protein 18
MVVYTLDFECSGTELLIQVVPELFYRYSPVLVQNMPNEIINLWLKCDFLNPRLLLPSMLNYKHTIGIPNPVIAYLEKVIDGGVTDKVIHNYLFQLYVSSGESKQDKLLDYIRSQVCNNFN